MSTAGKGIVPMTVVGAMLVLAGVSGVVACWRVNAWVGRALIRSEVSIDQARKESALFDSLITWFDSKDPGPGRSMPPKEFYYSVTKRPGQLAVLSTCVLAVGSMLLTAAAVQREAYRRNDDESVISADARRCTLCDGRISIEKRDISSGQLVCPHCSGTLHIDSARDLLTGLPAGRARLKTATRFMTFTDLFLHGFGIAAMVYIIFLLTPKVMPDHFNMLFLGGLLAGLRDMIAASLLLAAALGIVGAVCTYRGSRAGIAWATGAAVFILAATASTVMLLPAFDLAHHVFPEMPAEHHWWVGPFIVIMIFRFGFSVAHVWSVTPLLKDKSR